MLITACAESPFSPEELPKLSEDTNTNRLQDVKLSCPVHTWRKGASLPCRSSSCSSSSNNRAAAVVVVIIDVVVVVVVVVVVSKVCKVYGKF